MEEGKTCTDCKIRKGLSEFYPHRRYGRIDLKSICKACDSERAKQYYEKNAGRKKQYAQENRERIRDYQKWYRRSDPERTKRQAHENYVRNRTADQKKTNDLRFQYGLSLAQYNEMSEKQSGVCAVCRKPETTRVRGSDEVKGLAVDHCHDTGKIRGLLCRACNIGLGLFRDDPALLRRAVEYLESFK